MSKFKFGEEVVCVVGRSKGKHFIVDGFTCCPKCGRPCVYLKGYNEVCNMRCASRGDLPGCENLDCGVREYYDEALFEKLISLGETTEYRLRVTIPELIEIKDPQLQ